MARTALGLSETVLFESGRGGWALLTVVVGFVFGGWDVPDGFEDATVVEPVDVFEGGELDVFKVFPGSFDSDQFGLVEAELVRLGQGVVVRVTDGSDRGFDTGGGEAFGVPDR